MASSITTTRPGRVARILHLLHPSRRQVAFFLVTEAALTAIGAPLWVHLVAGGLLHLFVAGADGRS